MTKYTAVALLTLCLAVDILGKLGAPGGPQKLPRQVADSFQVFSSFPFAVAISDSDNETIFECVKTTRTQLDPEAQTATFAWVARETDFNPRQEVLFHVKAAEEPGTVTFTVDDDPTEKEGIFYYTDYEKCLVMDFEYRGHQCILWMPIKYKDDAPQECIDYFVDTCGVSVTFNRTDLCEDGEGDY
ncbi:uncharacterized protein LOC144151729 [Haemaphysalis longicornis]